MHATGWSVTWVCSETSSPAAGCGGARHPLDGHHLHGVQPIGQHRPGLALRRDPRVISTQEWARISVGLIQRLTALNLFIEDLYGDAKVVADGVFPDEVLSSSVNYLPQCKGIHPPQGVRAHICGSDPYVTRTGPCTCSKKPARALGGLVHAREPPGHQACVRGLVPRPRHPPRRRLPQQACRPSCCALASSWRGTVIAVLTPGIFNSAYFEHAFLAQQMGAHLVEGKDLVVEADDCVYMRTIAGLVRSDVIYRRVDDIFLDPEEFRPDSLVGVRGLMRAWRAGNVAIANAPGAGVADDKVVYSYVPALIRYYLGEEPKIPNVPTWLCHRRRIGATYLHIWMRWS